MLFTFVGCSFTVGEGLDHLKNDPYNYANIVAKNYQAEVDNLAVGGNSNYNIFMTAITDLTFNNPDKLFVQWSGVNRTWIYPDPNIANILTLMPGLGTTIFSDNLTKIHNPVLKKLFKNNEELQKFIDQYLLLNFDYKNLLIVIEYCNILQKIADEKNCQLILINGLLPWTNEIQQKLNINYFNSLSNYTKELVQFDYRSEIEIKLFLDNLTEEINTMNLDSWVNIFNNLQSKIIDYGNDNMHPGPKSHTLYADMIINYIEDHNDKRI